MDPTANFSIHNPWLTLNLMLNLMLDLALHDFKSQNARGALNPGPHVSPSTKGQKGVRTPLQPHPGPVACDEPLEMHFLQCLAGGHHGDPRGQRVVLTRHEQRHNA